MAKYTAQIEKEKRDRFALIGKARGIFDKADSEKRSMTTEERAEFDKLNETVTSHEKRIGDMEMLNKEDEQVEGDEPAEVVAEGERNAPGPKGRAGAAESRTGNPALAHATKEYRAAYRNWLITGEKAPALNVRTAVDMIMGTQSQGGYLVAPVEVSKDIVKQIDNLVFVRELAKIYRVTTTQAIGVRQMTTRVDDADWTTEIGNVAQDTSLAFGRRDLTPALLTKLVKASLRILESGVDAEGVVNEELAYKNAVSQEKAFLTGSGSGQPLGIFTASASGVPTAQDVTSGATADFIADDLIKLKYSLKQPYVTGANAASCRWVMGRPIIQEVRLFKDSYGQYLWRPGLSSDKPDTILDIPVAVSEYSPTVKTTGSYIAALGNFKYYGIAELKDWWIQRVVELFAGSNEIGFISRSFIDGSPLLGEAFVRLKTA